MAYGAQLLTGRHGQVNVADYSRKFAVEEDWVKGLNKSNVANVMHDVAGTVVLMLLLSVVSLR